MKFNYFPRIFMALLFPLGAHSAHAQAMTAAQHAAYTQQATQYAQQQQWQQQQNIMGANMALCGEALRPSAVLSGAAASPNAATDKAAIRCNPISNDKK